MPFLCTSRIMVVLWNPSSLAILPYEYCLQSKSAMQTRSSRVICLYIKSVVCKVGNKTILHDGLCVFSAVEVLIQLGCASWTFADATRFQQVLSIVSLLS